MTSTTPKPTVLIVDDEKNTREGLGRALKSRYSVLLAASGEEALRTLREEPIDILLSDIRMPGMDGVTLMRRALASVPGLSVILLTAYGSIETAVEAMKNGAYDFLTKPVNLDRLDILLQRALTSRTMETENRALREQLDRKYGMESMIGDSPAMESVYETIRQVAPTRATVLITGESGTGKELAARAIHALSPRKDNPFVAVHCAALTTSLLESELFGHEKGAFTGAVQRRKGRFETADGGTLFLDEIGEIDPTVQIKILRVLEEQSFERVGGSETVEVDVRLIAATNRDLRSMVEEGTFREDLYYRLNVVPLVMPPLRERREDIALLVQHYIVQSAEQNARPVEGITAEALEALQRHDWPGNVRELRNTVEHMVVLSRGNRLTLRDVPAPLRETEEGSAESGPALAGLSLQDAERQMIVNALKRNEGNRTAAAAQLGISRRTLHRKLNEYGLRETESA
jgi:two-component system, NtrC family, response regulator AtoC